MDIDTVKIDFIRDFTLPSFDQKSSSYIEENYRVKMHHEQIFRNESFYRGLIVKLDLLEKELVNSNDKIREEQIKESIKLLTEEIIYRKNVIQDIKMSFSSI